jgi:hypothetical protein
VNFFLDNTFSPNLARALVLLSEKDPDSIRCVRDHYGKDPGDPVWLEDVKKWKDDWVIFSGDIRITRTPILREMYLSSGRPMYLMPSGFTSKNRWLQASGFCKWFPDIQIHTAKVRGARCFNVKENGKIEERKLKF